MARPRASELTERELEIMQVFWDVGEATAQVIREQLEARGRELAYTTVATLVKILLDKGFLEQTGKERPFTYQPVKSFDEVSGNLLKDMIARVFGSREQLLVRLMSQQKLTKKERQLLEEVLREQSK
jgi:BlaI family transcriptional regulator, penicillinase repressor